MFDETVSSTDDLVFTDFLDASFQELILGLLVRDRDFMARARGVVQPKYFSARVYHVICDALFKYWDTYFELPSCDILAIAVSKTIDNETVRDTYVAATKKLYDLCDDDLDRPFIENELVSFCQRAEAASAVTLAAQNRKDFDIDTLARKLHRVQQLPSFFSDLGISVRSDWRLIHDEDTRLKYPTGFQEFDRCLRGGAREGELISIIAPLKRGKSLILNNIARGLMQMGNMVCIYTLEMYKEDYLRRTIASIVHKPINSIQLYDDDIVRISDILEFITDGDIIIKEFPAKTLSVQMLDGHLSMLEAKYGRKVVPVVDYADLLWMPGKQEEWKELAELYVLLRNLARRHGVPLFTASQTNGGGMNAEEIDATHQSGSKGKGFAVDAMFGVEQNKLDYAANRFKLRPFLNRVGRKDLLSYWKADYECAYIEEIDEEEFLDMPVDSKLLKSMKSKRKDDDD